MFCCGEASSVPTASLWPTDVEFKRFLGDRYGYLCGPNVKNTSLAEGVVNVGG